MAGKMIEKGPKVSEKKPQDIAAGKDTPSTGIPPIKVRNFKTAKRLLSRLIVGLQQGTIKGQDAKDLCYLLNTFMQLTRDYEMDQRLRKLEEVLPHEH